jgi:hypothetical protein
MFPTLDFVPRAPMRRIFVVGCARSGTTLLQRLLAETEGIKTFPETHFFCHLHDLTLGGLMYVSPRRRRNIQRELIRANLAPIAARLDGAIPLLAPYIRRFVRSLDAETRRSGCVAWIEKTPSHLRRIPVISRHVPGARFVHIVRNAPDVVASLHEMYVTHPKEWNCPPGRPVNVREIARHWIDDALLTDRLAGRPRHTVIEYRTLVENPDEAIGRICERLRLAPAKRAVHARRADDIVPAWEPWKRGALATIAPPDSRKYWLFPDDARAAIEDELSRVQFTRLSRDLLKPIA